MGDQQPPTPLTAEIGKGSVLKEVRVIYPPSKHEPIFWQPLAHLSPDSHMPFARRLASMDVSWLTLYIVAYLPILLIFRSILRLA